MLSASGCADGQYAPAGWTGKETAEGNASSEVSLMRCFLFLLIVF